MADGDNQNAPFTCGEVFPLPANPALSDQKDPADDVQNAPQKSVGGTITDASEFAIVGIHSRPPQRELFVAPSPPGGAVNTVGIDLIPVACFGLASFLFEFDSSFVLPTAGKALPDLVKVRRANKDKLGRLPLLSLFGHADPVGKDEYNKQLSGRRARAIFGLLRHRVSQWQVLIDEPFGGDDWAGRGLLEIARRHTGLSKSVPRKALIEAYMASLFPEPLAAEDFLGRGADIGGKADFQGCADFNPILILSAAEMKTLSKAERDRLNLPDRRVLIFLFDAGIKLDAKLWPCPRATESTAGCRDRFFADGDARRTPGAVRREHRGPNDFTFACRFYDRIAQKSPCERLLDQFRIRLFDTKAKPLPFAPWALIDSKRTRVGRADSGGFLSFLAAQPPGTCVLKWSRPPKGAGAGLPDPAPDDAFEFSIDIHLGLADGIEDAKKRLQNLAYVNGPALEDDVRLFQRDYQNRFPAITINGQLDPPTIDALREAHDICELEEKGKNRG